MLSLKQWLRHIEKQHHNDIELGLDRVSTVWKRMGNPQFECPVIVVGGTNGKGSTIRYLEGIYQHAGYKTGVYTSPHIIQFNERIVVDGIAVSDHLLVNAFEVIESARNDIPLTYFEYGTLAALWIFRHQQLSVVLLEVGMGGRQDAVNILDHDVAIVTNVSLDHTEWLGNDTETIAYEKAGIARSGKPLIYADTIIPLRLAQYAEDIDARLIRLKTDFDIVQQEDGLMTWSDASAVLDDLPLPAIAGQHQIYNLAAALTAIRYLEKTLTVHDNAIREAIKIIQLSGRFETLSQSPRIIVDVSHNVAAITEFAGNVQQIVHRGRKIAIFAMQKTRPCQPILQCCQGLFDEWHLCPLAEAASHAPHELHINLKAVDGDVMIRESDSVAHALKNTLGTAKTDDVIFVFGSFYTVSEAISELGV